MSIRVVCPHCGMKLNAPDAAAGRRLACPKCSTPVVIPCGESTGDAPIRRTQPRSEPGRRKSRPITIGIAAAGLVVAGGVALTLGCPSKVRKAEPEPHATTPPPQTAAEPKPAGPPAAVVGPFAHAEVVGDANLSLKRVVRALESVRDYRTAEDAIRTLERETAVQRRCAGMLDDLGTPPDAAAQRLVGLLAEYHANLNAAVKAAGSLASGVTGDKEPTPKDYDARVEKAVVEFGTATQGVIKSKAVESLRQRLEELRDEWDRTHGSKDR